MMRYWVYLQGEVPGSFDPAELAAMPDVGPGTLVCPAEGEILEKNWRSAGEFPDLAAAFQARDRAPARPAALPSPAPDASETAPEQAAADVEKFLDNSSSKLFRHVSELMRELEVRRDERSLATSLQRQVAELKDALQKSREKAALLEDRMAVLTTLEDAVRKNEIHTRGLEEALKKSETAGAELHVKHETCRTELENAKRRLTEAGNDLSIRNRLVDKLSKELTERDLALAKALAVIRRFEEEMGRICPEAADIEGRSEPRQPSLPLQPEPRPVAQAPVQPSAPVASVEPSLVTPDAPRRPYTTDDPPSTPPPLTPVPATPPEAQNALVRFLRKYFSVTPH
ncbi:MAG: hypothetical protein HY924_03955 [Elusimicrobia bacterium]|nr:hypothetical protein [Elusimicrobiota bacterium]